MNQSVKHLFLFLSIFFFSSDKLYSQLNLESSIPNVINGWNSESDDRYFDNETLFSYIDGAAEMFLSFGFSKVFNRIYSKKDQPDIILDIFYMNNSYDAFGVFSHSVGKIENEFGQQSQKAEGAIIFWKNNFYVSITANPETIDSKETIAALAKVIDKSIEKKGETPKVLQYLPQNNLNSESIRYFRHYNWLNSHTFISNENILSINQNTHGILARYSYRNKKAIFLIIMYPDMPTAENALVNFINNYEIKLLPGKVEKSKKEQWFEIKSIRNFVVGIFNSSSKEFVEEILGQAEELITK
jgi:hypothetical protein